tara:strand:+ start:1281 stop:2135 length:855 start_codon:yes stop_codon:yes gene_type:complete
MGNNASSDSDINRKPDNPQETLNMSNYYYSGFFAGEMTCSIIKATNRNPKGHFYMVDFTVSNADKKLLEHINHRVMGNIGVISPIKGAFNLKVRGKNRVRKVLKFLQVYSIIVGDLAKNRIDILSEALEYLDTHRGHHAHEEKTELMDSLRHKLRLIKTEGMTENTYELDSKIPKEAIGYFLAGIIDGEGSFGIKQSGKYKEPFFSIAMKDRKIIELMCNFLEHGKVRYRKDGVYHYEVNSRKELLKIANIFLVEYPLQQKRQRDRLVKLQRILNDYTRNHSRK